jgi:hypothetical protein
MAALEHFMHDAVFRLDRHQLPEDLLGHNFDAAEIQPSSRSLMLLRTAMTARDSVVGGLPCNTPRLLGTGARTKPDEAT